MNLKLTFFLLHLTTIFLFSCKKEKSDLDNLNIRGQVKELTVSRYLGRDNFGEIVADSLEEMEKMFYDSNGNLKLSYEYNTKGLIERKKKISRNVDLKILSKSFYDSKDSLIQIYQYEYDSIGHLQSIRNIDSKKIILQASVFKYDKNGFLIENRSYKGDGSLSTISRYQNDSNGLPLVMKVFDPLENIIEIYATKFDKNSNILEKEHNIRNTFVSRSTFVYDNNNELVEENYYSSQNQKPITKRTYNYLNRDKYNNWTVMYSTWISGDKKILNKTVRSFIYY
jgi:YD repeat-containing protein